MGLALLAALAAGLALLMRSESFALGAGRALQPALALAARVARRPAPTFPEHCSASGTRPAP